MNTLTQKQFDTLIERWNGKNKRLGFRRQAVETCRTQGHTYAISPLTSADGDAVLVCTRCMRYVNQERRAA